MSSAPSAGQKVKNDPRANQRIPESIGVVTSDSLAAESMNAHGSFGSGNPHAAPMKQPSKSTNTNNTDTSGAYTLDPAPNREAREDRQPFKGTAELDQRGHARRDSGTGPNRTPRERDGGTGGAEMVEDKTASNKSGSKKQASHTSGSKKQSSHTSSGKHSSAQTGPSKQASNVAPRASYEHSQEYAATKVKGKNLKSGDDADFQGNEPNASFNAEVGTEDDPGRQALKQTQYRNTESLHDAGGASKRQEKGASTGGVYSALESDERV